MSNVVGILGAAQDPDEVLEAAKGEYGSVLIIGWSKDGEFYVRASLDLNLKDCLWLTEAYKFNAMRGDYNAYEE